MIHDTLEQAVTAAKKAQLEIASINIREAIIENIRSAIKKHASELSLMAVDETGFGNIDDKIEKHLLIANKTPGVSNLENNITYGDGQQTKIESMPWGVIASVTPSTNPSCTVFNNAISMISAGNAIVFAPHPSAKKVTHRTIELICKASQNAGGPIDICTTIREPSIDTAKALFQYPEIDLLVVTGGEAVVKTARETSDKRVIAAGPGNPPVIVDETADIPRAAQKIVHGASFDNNIVCATEKVCIAVESICDELRHEMLSHHAYEITPEQADHLSNMALSEKTANPNYVGKDAYILARAIGIDVPESAKLLIFKASHDHPFVHIEQMMPVLPIVSVSNFAEAVQLAKTVEAGRKHTCALHTNRIDAVKTVSDALKCALFAVNDMAISTIGVGTNSPTTMTISTPTGEGVTTCKTFTRRITVNIDFGHRGATKSDMKIIHSADEPVIA